MRAKLVSKTFFIFFCSLFLVSMISAQEKPRATRLGNISETEARDFQILNEKLKSFMERLAKEPETTKGYIDIPINTELGKKIKSFIAENTALNSRILFWGKLRHPELRQTFPWGIYLWLVPQDAEVPYTSIHEAYLCPTLNIDSLIKVTKQNFVIIFTAKAQGGEAEDKITYVWKVSAGKIVEGRGTPVIKVDAKGAKEITATVEIGGVREECQREVSFTTKINQEK